MGQCVLKAIAGSLITFYVVIATPREINEQSGVNYVDKSLERVEKFKPSIRGYERFLGNTQLECKPRSDEQKIQCR